MSSGVSRSSMRPAQVAAAIVVQEGRVLVTRRAPGQKLEGFWEFPGGKLECDERLEDCIVRELLEELGVDCLAGSIFARSIYEYPGGSIELIGVSVTLLSNDFQLAVHDAVRWVLPAELRELNLAPADIDIAEEIIRQHG